MMKTFATVMFIFVLTTTLISIARSCVKTVGGTGGGECCEFPFTYKGNLYLECTDAESAELWCYTKSGWGNCFVEGSCANTVGGTAAGECCVFPFTYKGNSYTECTDKDSTQLWCYTKSGWGNCGTTTTTLTITPEGKTTEVTQPSTTDPGVLSSAQIANCLKSHNMLRAIHKDTLPLQWDVELAKKAQRHANDLVKQNKASEEILIPHDTTINKQYGLGENIYWINYYGDVACSWATLSWYKELNNYIYETASGKRGKTVGHFTQLVWKSSKLLGVGIATMPARMYAEYGNTETYIVAKYSPAGNSYMYGEHLKTYTENVAPRIPGAVTPTAKEME